MKIKKYVSLVLMAGLMVAPAVAADKASKKAKKGAAEMGKGMDPEMMKKWEAYATPGAAHKVLEPLVGSFSYTSKFWMAPGGKPEESTGTEESKWILGGRFVEATGRGTTMGKPFEGRAITGYDNLKKQYNTIWIDDMATGMMISSGEYDAASGKLSMVGTASCPIEGTKTLRTVTTVHTDGNHMFEMFSNGPDGKEFKMMEINYSKKK